ncbi:hypothetical protein JCM8097_008586 [Rhodosporidiobolus ruineniae]
MHPGREGQGCRGSGAEEAKDVGFSFDRENGTLSTSTAIFPALPTYTGGHGHSSPASTSADLRSLPNSTSQIGFTHRPSFFNKLGTAPESISTLFLLAMLAVSARYTPSLLKLHGGTPQQASSVYMEQACQLLGNELAEPTLERVQALYMLGLCDLGAGNGFRATVLQSVARQMAEMLELHKPSSGMSVAENETRRRTWWMLTFDSSLKHAVGSNPDAFDPLKVPIPLPSRECDFTNGVPSEPVIYFPGSRFSSSPLVPGRLSEFGALLYVGRLFASASRAVCNDSGSSSTGSPAAPDVSPWEPNSFSAQVQQELQTWLAALAPEQKWSTANLLAYRTQNLDYAFYNIFSDFHSIQMLTRRTYLSHLIRALAPAVRNEPSARKIGGREPPEGNKWFEQTAEALVMHAFDVFELTETLTTFRPCDKGIPPHLTFCIYLAGSILNYLRLCPWLSPSRAPNATGKIRIALSILQANIAIWPIVERWHQSLSQQASAVASGEGLTDLGDHAERSAEAELQLDRDQGLYRHMPPQNAASMDAASTLATLARPIQPNLPQGSDTLTAPSPSPPAIPGSLPSFLFPPPPPSSATAPEPNHPPSEDPHAASGTLEEGSANYPLDFGDLTELNAYFGSWGTADSLWAGYGLDGAL